MIVPSVVALVPAASVTVTIPSRPSKFSVCVIETLVVPVTPLTVDPTIVEIAVVFRNGDRGTTIDGQNGVGVRNQVITDGDRCRRSNGQNVDPGSVARAGDVQRRQTGPVAFRARGRKVALDGLVRNSIGTDVGYDIHSLNARDRVSGALGRNVENEGCSDAVNVEGLAGGAGGRP